MLKKVLITNVHTGSKHEAFVDTDTHEKAIIGSGLGSNETANIEDITGVDETVHRLTLPKENLDDRVLFFNGLARCLERNISIIKSLQLQANRVRSPKYRGVIAELVYDLSIGEKFSAAIEKHPDVFPKELLSLIVAGEEAGQLATVCRRIGGAQKKTARILKKLKAGMIYPAIVLALGVGVIVVMSYTLVPAMQKLYTEMNVPLATGTKILLAISDTLLHQPWTVLLPVLGLYFFFKNWGKISSTKMAQSFFLKLPVVGKLIRKSASAVSFRCLAMLLEANVRLSSALQITAEATWHWQYREFFDRLASHINVGRTMHEAFLIESHWLGPDGRSICGLIELASETGAGTEMLNEIADDYEDELDTMANQIDKILEPLTIMLLGCLVGFLVYAIYAPIFSLGDAILPKKG
ncbi:protein transport protein HofC/type IV pilus assembly protein PilC [Roseimicrobium gellanilyticum]|uniref:Protein transport protein HofC/type IV pilus assembly protein PilC n=1 Tax=Roseimicrobium gellanilyticum TaxID=748857 RepID=A0A366H8M0_9BACT|nr:type II secretion system F family protein [Roseimicrobium gellanilyticum]RBP37384.1 protein transport protein HofC/type IV pilus assembly protein PilC [Roseimicrobium gellanilyticum]